MRQMVIFLVFQVHFLEGPFFLRSKVQVCIRFLDGAIDNLQHANPLAYVRVFQKPTGKTLASL